MQYQKLLDDWFARVDVDKERPNEEQMSVLHAVRDRILVEKMLEKEGGGEPGVPKRTWRSAGIDDPREEPLRGFVHGLPGTGKSRVIKWTIRLFTEALEWEHGVQFVCVAFQNKVAFNMGGSTLHSCGDMHWSFDSMNRK